MTVSFPIQTNFTAGELSPRLWAHTDIAKYKNGLKEATNVVIMPHGPVRRRNGWKYVNEVKDSTKAVRLIDFEFDQSNAYILEFGNQYIRFYTNGGQVQSGGSPYEVSTTYLEAELFSITYAQYGRLLYLFHGSHGIAQLKWTSSASWELKDITLYPPPTTESGWSPSCTITPSATTGTGVNFTASASIFQAGDVGRQIKNLVGAGRASIKSVTTGFVAVCDIVENFPSTSAIAANNWKLDLSTISTITPSASKEGAIVTLSASNNAFRGDDVGRYVLVNNGVVQVNAVASAAAPTGEIQKSLTAITATSNYTVETAAWSSSLGYPAIGVLHQQRLWAANISTDPSRLWASMSGIFDAFGGGSQDDDALDLKLTGRQVSKITWMAPVRGQLAVGTTSGEFTIDGSTNGGPITPSSTSIQPRGYHGSNLQQPVGLDDEIIYIQRSGTKINSFRYDFQIDNYVSEDLLFLAEHLGADGVKELAYAQDPDRNLYAVLNSGDLLVCTYVKEQQVVAWAKWTTDGDFESIRTISTGTYDEVWAVIKRTINGSTKRYIEKLDVSTGESNIDGFSDCYLTYSAPKAITGITKANPGVVTATAHGFNNGDHVKLIGVGGMTEVENITFVVANKTANTFELTDLNGNNVNTTSYTTYTSGGNAHKLVTTISGLSHLEGKTVQVKTDGAAHPDCTVSSGSITLAYSSYEVVVGLEYEHIIRTLPMEYNPSQGSVQSQQSRWVRPVLRFYKSAIPLFNDESVPTRAPTDLMDKKLGLYTGDVLYGAQTWKSNFSNSIKISSAAPFPMILLGMFGSIEGGSQ